jgi:hypothetical protein
MDMVDGSTALSVNKKEKVMEHRIQYLRDSKGQPTGCIAIKVKPVIRAGVTGGTTLVMYQMSVLNPLDEFDRKIARRLALGALAEAPLTTTIDHLMPTRRQITQAVMSDIKHDPTAPTRARKAASLWIRGNPYTHLPFLGRITID